MSEEPARGFIVHAWAEIRKNRLCYAGRLLDGRSFGLLVRDAGRVLHARETDIHALPPLPRGAPIGTGSGLETLRGEACAELRFDSLEEASRYAARAEAKGMRLLGAGRKAEEAWLIERGIRLSVELRGAPARGRRLDAVWAFSAEDAAQAVAPAEPAPPPLRSLFIDIETSREGATLAIGLSMGDIAECLYLGRAPEGPDGEGKDLPTILPYPDEAALLSAFAARVRALDPDILLGWNIIDFDLAMLARAFERHGMAFDIARGDAPAKYFAAEGGRSASLYCQGRQVLDAMRLARGGERRFEDLRLETVALEVLGEGKDVALEGDAKLAELERLYREEPARFCSYCHRDAWLARRVMEETGLLSLTVSRAALTGAPIDKAWTSIASFERVYATGLRARGVAEPPEDPWREVSGAAGGTILEPEPGIFRAIAVLDFRSLYPSIIRTFNVDPLAHARAGADAIEAPNGARFSRGDAILPGLIAEYTEARARALASGDADAAHVYKILMNSFYGVLGTAGCRYGLTELAGAITSFAKRFLRRSRDWFRERGYKVIYGDTDSLFILTGLPEASGYDAYAELAGGLCEALNALLGEEIARDYAVESFLRLSFDKAYARFFIPRVRSEEALGDEARGRAKGYAGLKLLPEGGSELEVKGMEAARSDSSPLARRVQRELLSLVFGGAGREAIAEWLRDLERALYSGRLDAELVYRKKLRRRAASYEKTTPPHVRAARMLGVEERGGWIEYLVTTEGPEPLSMRASPIDYDDYLRGQVLPVAKSIGMEAGFDPELILGRKGQLELGLL
jgi:DNA polymerase-2